MANPTPRVYGETSYGQQTYSAPPRGYVGFDSPWHLSGIRVDGLTADGPLSPVRPGQSRTLSCLFAPQPPGGADTDDHLARYERARQYLVNAADVVTYDPPGQRAYYREQYDGPSQLLRIAPLAADSDGAAVDGTVPGRDSRHLGRWAVVTGGSPAAGTGLDSGGLGLELQVMELGLAAEPPTNTTRAAPVYTTREAALDAFERNSL